MSTFLRASGAIFVVLSVVACSADASEDGPPPLGGRDGTTQQDDGNGAAVTIGPDGLPVGPDGKPIPTRLDGRYELSNRLDLSSAGVFPDTVSDALQALTDFREKPSSTIAELLQAANVPVVSQVLGLIPSLIRDQVLGFVDDHVFKSLYAKVPVTKQITGIVDDVASIATKFEVVSELEFPEPVASGNVMGAHRIKGIAFNWMEKRNVVNSPDVLRTLQTQKVKINAVRLDAQSPELESGRLALGDHTFSIPIGSFAVLATDKLAAEKFGVKNLLEAVGKIVDCAELASDVAARCIGIGPAKVCVGHETEIRNLCTVGLDAVVSVVQGKIKALDVPALHLSSGTAKMWDAPAPNGKLDAKVDRIDEGYYTAGVGPKDDKILATFSGRRVADALPSGTSF